MIEIDGSYLEGGGQIIRTAVALSSITQKPIRIINIRKGRPKPGLSAQHLAGVLAAAKMCGAKIKGAEIGSTTIEFSPEEIKGGSYKFNVGTAGAVNLVLQTLVPIACYADKETELIITGGTDVAWSPSYSYFDHIFCVHLHELGAKIERSISKYGFYPKGGGEVVIKIKPYKSFLPLNLTMRGEITKIDVHSIASEQLKNAKVAERMIDGFIGTLKSDAKVNKIARYVDSLSYGASLCACASFGERRHGASKASDSAHAHFNSGVLGATVLGEPGKRAEAVGKECAEALQKEIASGATVDHRMADQVLLFLALAASEGKASEFATSRISNHLKTNAWVIKQFLPVEFEIDGLKISVGKK